MKAYILFGSIVCITCIFTVLIFLDFRNQHGVAKNFRQQIHNAPITVRHLFISPELVKVKNWQIGQSSVYHLKTNWQSKQISFQVAAKDPKNNDRFWLRTSGLFQFNELDIEVWRLLTKTNLRPGSEQRAFVFSHNSIPFPFQRPDRFLPNPIVLEKLEDEVLVTPMGPIQCKHYLTYIRSPDEELKPLLELWTNPSVLPLGIVRARWQDAHLDLVSVKTNAVPKIPSILLQEFDRHISLEGACTRCHAEGIGGQDVKLEYINLLSGTTLNLTTALFHLRQTELVKSEDLIHIQSAENLKRTKKRGLVRFSWENGSFWVKPSERGKLALTLDAIAHQGNITVQPRKGTLALKIEK